MSTERLQKIIAAAGIASRRKAEQLITGGLVSVNGQVVTELGSKADAATDHIRVNGKLLHGAERHLYVLLLNKPKGYVTTLRDPEGRPTVMDLLHGVSARVYPVGRLDYASEGLLLLTNDGEFANYLMKAASHVPKTYMVKVAGQPTAEGLARLRAGLFIASPQGRRVEDPRPRKSDCSAKPAIPGTKSPCSKAGIGRYAACLKPSDTMSRRSSGCATGRSSWTFIPGSSGVSRPRKLPA